MEKFNQAPAPAKVESEPVADVAESTGTVETFSDSETTEGFAPPAGAFMNDVPSSPESVPESPSEKVTRLREQKSAATDRLNSEFWPDELEQASIFQTRELLRKSTRLSDVETNDDDVDIPPRVREAMEMNDQLNAFGGQIDQVYDEHPDLVESRVKEILSTHFTPDRLAIAQSQGLLWRDHDAHRNTIPLYNKELQSLLSKFEKHQGYDRSKDIDTIETRSPKYDFVEGYVAQLIQERADEVTAYEALSTEEKERYPDKQTVREKLSYQDADFPPEQLETMLRDAEGREMAEKYAHQLNKLPKEDIDRALPSIKGQTKKVLSTLGVAISPYGESDSWAYWDLGKQQYYYEQNKDSELEDGNPYTYAPALEKPDEISDRHIGWEFYHAPAETREQAFKSIEDTYYLARVFEVLQNDPKADGQLPSHEYAELGKILREYARSKESEDNIDDFLAVQREANYEGDDSLLLFERLDNPKIHEQIVQMWLAGYKAKEGKKMQRPKQDENGEIIFNEDGSYILEDVPFVPPTEEETREKIAQLIEEVKTSTPISFDERSPTADNIGIFWKMPDGTEPTLKQKTIMLAHEKGHVVRQFPGGLEGDQYYSKVFGKALDTSCANYTQQDYERDVARLRHAQEAEGYIPEDEDHYSFENVESIMRNYLARPEEIVERMGQLKNYFGFKGDEEFTQEHLDYARMEYIKDTGMDNHMRHFFESIVDDQEFLRLINSVGV